MKLRKRLAAVLLSAVMILTGLTACDGTAPAGPAELTWQNSRTKQYFDAKGITAQEYTLTADMMASGQKVELKYAIKGKRAGYETAADHKLRVDADGNVYLIGFRGSNKELEWWKYPAGSPTADSYAASIRMAFNKEKQSREAEQISKKRLSSDCRLQLAYMKSELLVIVGQHTTVNTFPGLVHTARQTMRVGNTRSR